MRESNPTKGWNPNQDKDNNPFQDETLSTECSSLSSETFRGQDLTRSKEDDEDYWSFCDTGLYPHSKIRFTEEPIVFSNDRSMNQELCWLDKADVGLYLLEDCADPWDYGGSSGEGGEPLPPITELLIFRSKIIRPRSNVCRTQCWMMSNCVLVLEFI